MSRVKLCLLEALAMLVVSAVAVSSASAIVFSLDKVECKGAIVTFCWEAETGGVGLQELKGEQTFEGLLDIHEVGEAHFFEATLGESVIHIVCEGGAKAEGTMFQPKPLEATPTLKGKIEFTKCTLSLPLGAKCKVSETIVTTEIEGTMPETGEVLFKPAVGKMLAEIEFSGAACPATVKGVQPLTGEQICLWVEPEVDLKEHLLFCPTEDSKLKLGGSKAILLVSFEVALLGLNDLWDITLG